MSVCVPVARAPACSLEVDLTAAAGGHYQISCLTLFIQKHPFSCPWGRADEAEVTGRLLGMVRWISFSFVVRVVHLLVYLFFVFVLKYIQLSPNTDWG